ncbi:hypothetical protein [Deefgea sp. CFH1-16]|uniref:hypothetical protein n=1 Tax=Deefgea sp. CFH1-16 TaxID=2675457 RepID=UPI0015F760B1|nr:hypothetical protein [Deefgea sp. CFH1-16]MBM5573643.1 hypothetical protein [Deefgea sp. CFH1-16]
MPRPAVALDITGFKNEIAELLRDSTHLRNEQDSLRVKAFEYATQKELLTSQIVMARNALRDLEGDLKYLTEFKTDPLLTCPTCGTTHESGFHVRLELIDDAVTLRNVLAELVADQHKCEEHLANVQVKINRIKRKTLEIERILQTKKGLLRLKDVIDSHSSDVIRGAFAKDLDALKRQLTQQEDAVASLKDKVSQFDSPERTKTINDFYSERIELFASELEVQDLREDVKKRPDASVSASGSALPRSLLAYQFAILHTAYEKGDSKLFPVVVDSPNQQGQDAGHLTQMLNFIVKRTPEEQQLILAVEDHPNDFSFDGEIILLEKPFNLLESDQYEVACAELGAFLVGIEASIDAMLVRKVDVSSEPSNE